MLLKLLKNTIFIMGATLFIQTTPIKLEFVQLKALGILGLTKGATQEEITEAYCHFNRLAGYHTPCGRVIQWAECFLRHYENTLEMQKVANQFTIKGAIFTGSSIPLLVVALKNIYQKWHDPENSDKSWKEILAWYDYLTLFAGLGSLMHGLYSFDRAHVLNCKIKENCTPWVYGQAAHFNSEKIF